MNGIFVIHQFEKKNTSPCRDFFEAKGKTLLENADPFLSA